jgi:hypothetical protein
MNIQPSYTVNSLAAECGISVRQLQRHLSAGTLKLHRATEKIPGVGVRINGELARKFIEAMRAKHGSKLQTHVSV